MSDIDDQDEQHVLHTSLWSFPYNTYYRDSDQAWFERVRYAIDTQLDVNYARILELAAQNGQLNVVQLVLTSMFSENIPRRFWEDDFENSKKYSEPVRKYLTKHLADLLRKEAEESVDFKPCKK